MWHVSDPTMTWRHPKKSAPISASQQRQHSTLSLRDATAPSSSSSRRCEPSLRRPEYQVQNVSRESSTPSADEKWKENQRHLLAFDSFPATSAEIYKIMSTTVSTCLEDEDVHCRNQCLKHSHKNKRQYQSFEPLLKRHQNGPKASGESP